MTVNHVKDSRRGVPTRYQLVWWVLVLSAVAFMDRTNISIAGVSIGREFGIDNAHLGWIFSAFLIGYASFQIPGGVLARRLGPRRVIAIGVIWSGIFTALTASIPSGVSSALALLVVIRFSLAAGEAITYPAANQFVERWFPIEERGKANGIIFGGVGLGSGLTPPLMTMIMLHYGWRASFWASSIVVLAAGSVWYVIARDTPEEHPHVSAAELQLIVAGRSGKSAQKGGVMAADKAGVESKQRVPWSRMIRSKEVLALTGSYFTFGYVAWIFFSWFYIYLVQVRGLNLRTSAVYSMLPFIAMTLGSLTGGVVSDWLSRTVSVRAGRCFLPAFALAITALLLCVGSRAGDARTATLVLACGAGALYLSQSSFWSVTADFAGQYSGIVSGTMNTGCQIGGAVTASLTPMIAAHFGWEASFLTATGLACLGAVGWLMVNPAARLGDGGPLLTMAPETQSAISQGAAQ